MHVEPVDGPPTPDRIRTFFENREQHFQHELRANPYRLYPLIMIPKKIFTGPPPGFDAGLDAGPDAGLDAGPPPGLDAGPDAGLDDNFDVDYFSFCETSTCSLAGGRTKP